MTNKRLLFYKEPIYKWSEKNTKVPIVKKGRAHPKIFCTREKQMDFPHMKKIPNTDLL